MKTNTNEKTEQTRNHSHQTVKWKLAVIRWVLKEMYALHISHQRNTPAIYNGHTADRGNACLEITDTCKETGNLFCYPETD